MRVTPLNIWRVALALIARAKKPVGLCMINFKKQHIPYKHIIPILWGLGCLSNR